MKVYPRTETPFCSSFMAQPHFAPFPWFSLAVLE
jgi:hypothetical protein